MNLNWLDLGILVLVGVGAFRGFKRGLIREGMAFLGLIVGIAMASRWQDYAAGLLKPFVGGGSLVHGLAYLLIVLAVLIAATLLTVILRRLARLLWVGWLDRVGGLAIGAIQGGLVAILILFLLVKFPLFGVDRTVKDSQAARSLLALLPPIAASLPPELAPVAKLFELPKNGAPPQ